MKVGARSQAPDDPASRAEGEQCTPAALGDASEVRTIRRDPKQVTAPVPGDAERVQPDGQCRNRVAAVTALENLTVEHARHPDCMPVGGDALDDPMLSRDGSYDVGFGDRGSCSDRQRDHRSAPAISL